MRRVLAVLGIISLVVGVVVLLMLGNEYRQTVSRDTTEAPRDPMFSLSLSLSKRTMSIHEDQVATIGLRNGGDTRRVLEVSISAPGFKVDQQHEWSLGPKESVTHSFILHPTQAGSYYVLVSGGGYRISRAVSVREFGLPIWILQWIGIITTILGPAITLPWILEFIKNRRMARAKEEEAKPRIIVPGE